MSGRILELLNRNLQEVFGEGDAARCRAVIEELYTRTASSMSQSASSSDATRWTSSQETCARPILTSRTRHAESRKRSIMPAAWPGDPVRAAKGPTIPAWT